MATGGQTGGLYIGAPGTIGAAIARDDRLRAEEQAARQGQVGNAAALNFLRGQGMEGTPATKAFEVNGRTVGQNRAAVPMSSDPLRALAMMGNPSSPLQSMAAQQAIQTLFPAKPTAQVLKPGETLGLTSADGKFTPTYTAPSEPKPEDRFKPTNMQIPGTNRMTIARTPEDFDRLAAAGFVQAGNSVPGAPTSPVTDPNKRPDYWREKFDPEFKAVNEASISLKKIENAIQSGAGMSTAVQLLQKLIDEKGVVRGEDVRMFNDAQPLLEAWKQELQQSTNGQLTEGSKTKILSTARALVGARYNAFNTNFDAYKPIIQADGVDPDKIFPRQALDQLAVRRFAPPQAGEAQAAAANIPRPQTQQDFAALPSGSVYIDPDDGRQYRKP